MPKATELLLAHCRECCARPNYAVPSGPPRDPSTVTPAEILACECRRCPFHFWRNGKGGDGNAATAILRWCREARCSDCPAADWRSDRVCRFRPIIEANREALREVRAGWPRR